MIFDDQKRLELSDSVPDVVFDAHYNAKYQEFLEFSQNGREYLNWYTGLSSINLPSHWEIEGNLIGTKYELATASLTGSVSTPYFRNTFDETKPKGTISSISWEFILHVPSDLTEGSNLTVAINYDLDNYDNVIILWEKPGGRSRAELSKTNRSWRRTYPASEYSANGKKLVL